MKVLAAAIFLIASATAESAYLDWRVFLPGAGDETESAVMDVVMNASLLEKVSSSIEFAVDDVGHEDREWVRSIAEVSMEANTNNNEDPGPTDESGAGEKEGKVPMMTILPKLDANEKTQADMNARLLEELADMNARLKELESKGKKSWFDTNVIWEYLTPGNLFTLYRLLKPYVAPDATTKVVCKTVVNQFVDSSTTEPICDSLSYAVDLVDVDLVKVKDEVINLID